MDNKDIVFEENKNAEGLYLIKYFFNSYILL